MIKVNPDGIKIKPYDKKRKMTNRSQSFMSSVEYIHRASMRFGIDMNSLVSWPSIEESSVRFKRVVRS